MVTLEDIFIPNGLMVRSRMMICEVFCIIVDSFIPEHVFDFCCHSDLLTKALAVLLSVFRGVGG